ncbi:unnamed protein product [marine sediment metagenome]|uniref:Uncharacterized protein n=1 Tax=marine sediment metagenome TaxID=412755 RepID=X1EFI4_9ZZZZ
MKNFYKEHKGYRKLKKKLSDQLIRDLINVIGDAIQHGVDVFDKNLKGGK